MNRCSGVLLAGVWVVAPLGCGDETNDSTAGGARPGLAGAENSGTAGQSAGGIAGASTAGTSAASGRGGRTGSAGTSPAASGRGGRTGSAGTSPSAAGGPLGQSGSPGSGGSVPGGCTAAPVGSCEAPQVRVSNLSLPAAVIGNGREADTEKIPMAIAAIPGGGSRLAWMGTSDQVHIAELDCNDQVVGTPFSLPAFDFQDIAADATGGVIVVTRAAEGGGTLNCGNPGNLCIAPNDPVACYDLWMVRFDTSGKEVWSAKLTTASAANPPYTANSGANHFIWWYQHHTRLAFDGTNYAAYFGDAITIRNGSCVDIHQGDRMQVVGPSGSLLSGHDSFAGGCSHSWNTRIVWDNRINRFVMVCATDNNMRVARPAPYRTILATPQGNHSLGDLILASGTGYWVTVGYQNTIRLLHFNEAAPDLDINAGSSNFSHLVAYGASRMVVAWESGQSISAQVRDAGDGSVVSPPFTIAVPDHRYQAFKSFPDGSVAYPGQGANGQSIRIARILPCGG